jgi:hypothetical protein
VYINFIHGYGGDGIFTHTAGETTDLLQVTDKLYHKILYRAMNGVRTHNFDDEFESRSWRGVMCHN